MEDSANIPSCLLEPDGVFQNLTVAAGVTVKLLQNGKTCLAVVDGRGESTILLNESERHHLVSLLRGKRASEEKP